MTYFTCSVITPLSFFCELCQSVPKSSTTMVAGFSRRGYHTDRNVLPQEIKIFIVISPEDRHERFGQTREALSLISILIIRDLFSIETETEGNMNCGVLWTARVWDRVVRLAERWEKDMIVHTSIDELGRCLTCKGQTNIHFQFARRSYLLHWYPPATIVPWIVDGWQRS